MSDQYTKQMTNDDLEKLVVDGGHFEAHEELLARAVAAERARCVARMREIAAGLRHAFDERSTGVACEALLEAAAEIDSDP